MRSTPGVFEEKKGGDPSCTLLIRLLVRAQTDARSSVGQDANRNSCQTQIIVHGKQGDKREAGSGEKREAGERQGVRGTVARISPRFANLRWAERGTQAASTALTSICERTRKHTCAYTRSTDPGNTREPRDTREPELCSVYGSVLEHGYYEAI